MRVRVCWGTETVGCADGSTESMFTECCCEEGGREGFANSDSTDMVQPSASHLLFH